MRAPTDMRPVRLRSMGKNVIWLTMLPLLAGSAQADRFAPQLLPGLTVTIHTLHVDDEIVWVHEYRGTRPGFTFVSLHDDENTAAQVAREYIAREGGRLVELRHGRGRNVAIRHDGHQHWFDPNRMFTPEGLARSLAFFLALSDRNLETASAFALAVERIINVQPGGTIISMHNNTDAHLSINDYRKGGLYGANTREIAVDSSRDRDDYFFTNDEAVFRALATAGYHAALMEEAPPDDMGSLAFLARRNGAHYVVIEAQHGHLASQREMLAALIPLLQKEAAIDDSTR